MAKRLFKIVDTATGTEIGDLFVISEHYPEWMSDTHHLEEVSRISEDLDTIKAYYKKVVNQFAGEVRARFLYEGFGQELTYLEREREATAYKAGGWVGTEAEYPFIFKIATTLDKTPQQIANAIINRGVTWRETGSLIEAQRERGMAQIESAIDVAGARAAKNYALASLDEHQP